MQIDLDRIDRLLLRELQLNGRLTSTELAERTHLSQSPSWRRVKRLEEAGIIAGYQAKLDRRSLGWGVLVFVTISIDSQDEEHSLKFEQGVRDIPEVIACHGVSGPEDFILVVVAQDLEGYSTLMQHKLRRLPGVKMLRSSFSMREVKAANGLPIPD
jgi:Lrp/AsnC family leucine-responsive transcriptional regulator